MNELKELMLRAPRFTLAVAESLTAGRVQAGVASVSGASEFFLGGVTAYSLEQKVKLLGVERAAAEKVNCASAAVAEQMARGVGALFGADIGVATTGYAEPSAAWRVSAPMAWWAVARRAGPIGARASGAAADDAGDGWIFKTGRVEFPGATRIEAQERAAAAALAALVAELRTIRGSGW
jgi:nicotinamide-nucleotide amidase